MKAAIIAFGPRLVAGERRRPSRAARRPSRASSPRRRAPPRGLAHRLEGVEDDALLGDLRLAAVVDHQPRHLLLGAREGPPHEAHQIDGGDPPALRPDVAHDLLFVGERILRRRGRPEHEGEDPLVKRLARRRARSGRAGGRSRRPMPAHVPPPEPEQALEAEAAAVVVAIGRAAAREDHRHHHRHEGDEVADQRGHDRDLEQKREALPELAPDGGGPLAPRQRITPLERRIELVEQLAALGRAEVAAVLLEQRGQRLAPPPPRRGRRRRWRPRGSAWRRARAAPSSSRPWRARASGPCARSSVQCSRWFGILRSRIPVDIPSVAKGRARGSAGRCRAR